MGPGGMGSGGGFGMGWTGLWWVLILVGVVAVVVGLVRAFRRGAGSGAAGPDRRDAGAPPPSTARQILDERFARGEIDEDEYHQRRRALDGRRD